MADKYISTKQAYDYLRSVLYETAINNAGVKVEDFATACQEIADNRLKVWLDNVPAADVVEVKRGRWVYDEFCSGCGKRNPPSRVIMGGQVLYQYGGEMNFCPNCGSYNREEKKDG